MANFSYLSPSSLHHESGTEIIASLAELANHRSTRLQVALMRNVMERVRRIIALTLTWAYVIAEVP